MTDDERDHAIYQLSALVDRLTRERLDDVAALTALRDVLQQTGKMAPEDFNAAYAHLRAAAETEAAKTRSQLEWLLALDPRSGSTH